MRRERRPELRRDLAGQVRLQRKDVDDVAVVLLGPEVPLIPAVDELSSDADAVPLTAYAPLENRLNSEQLRDLRDRGAALRVGEPEHGRA